jgi:hypothetical protein
VTGYQLNSQAVEVEFLATARDFSLLCGIQTSPRFQSAAHSMSTVELFPVDNMAMA